MLTKFLLALFFVAGVMAPTAFAYNCDQGCGDQCWVETPFGANINPIDLFRNY